MLPSTHSVRWSLAALVFAPSLAAGWFALGGAPPTRVVDAPGVGRVRLVGTGPPVVFSGGFFGSMPRQLYGRFLEAMARNVTVLTPETALPRALDVETFERIADAVGASELGFLAHSSFDSRILSSDRVARVALCDPIAWPRLEVLTGRFAPARVVPPALPRSDDAAAPKAPVPVLVVRAARAYDAEAAAPIPEFLEPLLDGDAFDVAREVVEGVGHIDLLDDLVVEYGRTALPWMRTANSRSTVGYDAWHAELGSQGVTAAGARRARAAYRARAAAACAAHFVADAAPSEAGDPDPVTSRPNDDDARRGL